MILARDDWNLFLAFPVALRVVLQNVLQESPEHRAPHVVWISCSLSSLLGIFSGRVVIGTIKSRVTEPGKAE